VVAGFFCGIYGVYCCVLVVGGANYFSVGEFGFGWGGRRR